MNKKFLLTLLTSLFLFGCIATTELTGVVDPAYRDNFKTNSMLILGFGMSIDEQKALEDTFVQAIEKYNVKVHKGLDIFPPTRDNSNKNIYKEARSNNIETIMLISSLDKETSETYVPPIYHPGRITSHVSRHGSHATVNTYQSSGYVTGGYSVSKPLMGVTATLYKADNKDIIWTADGLSKGNTQASFPDLAASAARASVTKMSEAGIIVRLKN